MHVRVGFTHERICILRIIRIYIYTYTHNIHTYIHTYTYICMHTYTHVYIYIYICTQYPQGYIVSTTREYFSQNNTRIGTMQRSGEPPLSGFSGYWSHGRVAHFLGLGISGAKVYSILPVLYGAWRRAFRILCEESMAWGTRGFQCLTC